MPRTSQDTFATFATFASNEKSNEAHLSNQIENLSRYVSHNHNNNHSHVNIEPCFAPSTMHTRTPKHTPILLLTFLLLYLYQILSSSNAVNPPTSWMEYSKSKWASFTNKSNYGPSKLRIDPRFILQTMKKFGGLLLPKEVEDDLKVLERVCRCESSYL